MFLLCQLFDLNDDFWLGTWFFYTIANAFPSPSRSPSRASALREFSFSTVLPEVDGCSPFESVVLTKFNKKTWNLHDGTKPSRLGPFFVRSVCWGKKNAS